MCKISKSFAIPNLRKIKFVIDFNGRFGYLCGEMFLKILQMS